MANLLASQIQWHMVGHENELQNVYQILPARPAALRMPAKIAQEILYTTLRCDHPFPPAPCTSVHKCSYTPCTSRHPRERRMSL